LSIAVAAGLGRATAMAARPQNNQSHSEQVSDEEVRDALGAIKSAYESRDIMMMMDTLDRDFAGWLEFKNAITNTFFSTKQLEILFVLDSCLTDKDRVNARLHWFKKTINLTGTFTKTEGSSQFIFKKSRGGLKLYALSGDNPFF
jgi:hypothetical protein